MLLFDLTRMDIIILHIETFDMIEHIVMQDYQTYQCIYICICMSCICMSILSIKADLAVN